jgi:hypothetical protein
LLSECISVGIITHMVRALLFRFLCALLMRSWLCDQSLQRWLTLTELSRAATDDEHLCELLERIPLDVWDESGTVAEPSELLLGCCLPSHCVSTCSHWVC